MTDRFSGRPSVLSQTLARDRLGVAAVAFFVLSAAAPLTVVAGVVTTAYAVTGLTAIAWAFPAVGAVLAVFAAGYVAMARRISNAGAFSAYVTHGLGRPAGVGAALVALGAYGCFAMAGFGGFGAAAAGLVASGLGWHTPWWAWALGAWVAVSVLGVLRVSLSGRVLAVLLSAEVAAIVLLDAAGLTHPAGGTLGVAGLVPDLSALGGAGAALAIAVTGFVGFEGSAVFAEETRDPRRTVARATYLCLGTITVLYAVSAWAMTVAAGDERIITAARTHGTETVFVLAGTHLPALAVDLGRVLLVTSLFAAQVSFWNFTTRYLFCLGREGVLPRRLGVTGPRSGAPVTASATLSALGLAVIASYAIAGADPLVHLFFYGGAIGGFGVLILLAATSAAIGVYFTGHHRDEHWWPATAAPALATTALVGMLALAVAHFHTLLGVPAHSPLRWVPAAAYTGLAAVGVVWALVLRAADPRVYAGIGLGPQAATGRTTHLTTL